jgi:nicotinamidase-related amidase
MPSAQAPHRSPAVLILIDVINHFEFPDGEKVLRQAMPIAPRLARLKKRARAAGMSSIYLNDNFGQWRSYVNKLLDYGVTEMLVVDSGQRMPTEN